MPSQSSYLLQRLVLVASTLAGVVFVPNVCPAAEPIVPKEEKSLFNGNDLSGLVPWLKATGHDDPEQVFSVVDGMIHMQGGEHRGYLATEAAYTDYHVSVEYKWGKQTDGGEYVRNSGLLINGSGAHGGASGVWMPSIEVQLAQGCEGDLIVIRGKAADGSEVKANLVSNTRLASDGRTRWDPEGKATAYSGRQFWWSQHDPEFKELLDTRGRHDVASPLGEWTRVDCICRDGKLTVKINGETVNGAYDLNPSGGHILLQNEGHEVYFRHFTIGPAGDG